MSLEKNKLFAEELKKWRPRSADPDLGGRIEQALKRAERSRRLRQFRSGMAWGAMALAATVLITFGILLFNGRLVLHPESETASPVVAGGSGGADADPPTDRFEPVLAENNLNNRIDEGIVFLRNGLTARRYRYEFIDRVVWRNPVDGATVEMEIPRDEVILIPVQTY